MLDSQTVTYVMERVCDKSDLERLRNRATKTKACEGSGRGRGTSRKIGWGSAAGFLKPLPYFRPKSVIFLTLFQT